MNYAAVFLQHYLLNSLWQAPLLFAGAWAAARLFPHDAALRHRIWVTTLLLQCVLPACYAPQQFKTALRLMLPHAGQGGTLITVGIGEGVARAGLHAPSLLLSLLTLLYTTTVLAFAIRLLWRSLQVSALRRTAVPFVLAPHDVRRYSDFCRQLGLHEVPLASSSAIFSPVTVGVLHRAVLLPNVLAHPPAQDDLCAALAHELAHVKRRDFAKNLLYEAAALPIAWHPALWGTRNAIAESRELVCDDIAAGLMNGRHVYAHSLLRLVALLAELPKSQTSHAIGMLDANAFERRIMELSRKSETLVGTRRILAVAASSAALLFTCGSALAFAPGLAPAFVNSEGQAQPKQRPVKVSTGAMAGNVLSKVAPVYPPEAKEAKIQGAVVMQAIIGRDGSIQSLQMVSGPEELRQSAWDAVKQWTYKPFLLNGQPTEVETTVTVTYSLTH